MLLKPQTLKTKKKSIGLFDSSSYEPVNKQYTYT